MFKRMNGGAGIQRANGLRCVGEWVILSVQQKNAVSSVWYIGRVEFVISIEINRSEVKIDEARLLHFPNRTHDGVLPEFAVALLKACTCLLHSQFHQVA